LQQKLKAETFCFDAFWQKDIDVKLARKNLMKLTPNRKECQDIPNSDQ